MRRREDPRNNREQNNTDGVPEMKRRERFRRPTDRTPASISTRRALLLLAVCILCIIVTKKLAGW